MNNTMLYPYKAGSASGRALAQALGIRRISHRNSTFRGNPRKTIINWGASRLPEEVGKCQVVNTADAVNRASDKLKFFVNADCRKPAWFTDEDTALLHAVSTNDTIVVRHVLNGNSGEGIELVEPGGVLPYAPLYTAYVPKKQEYRVHVFGGEVIDVQRKARRRDVADGDVNWKVRNHANGFIFARNAEALGEIPEDVLVQATQAVSSIGLDFGAADVVFNERSGLAYVLEVNTSPGLEGSTLDNYVNAFNGLQA